MSEVLSAAELSALVARVFVPTAEDGLLGIMIDLPDAKVADDASWAARRQIAAEWVELLETDKSFDLRREGFGGGRERRVAEEVG